MIPHIIAANAKLRVYDKRPMELTSNVPQVGMLERDLSPIDSSNVVSWCDPFVPLDSKVHKTRRRFCNNTKQVRSLHAEVGAFASSYVWYYSCMTSVALLEERPAYEKE